MRLLRRIGFGLSLVVLLVAPAAQAHVLKQDDGVSAVLHIQPFDAPVSGTPTVLEIEFSNTSNTFALNDYHVGLKLRENGSLVRDYPVEAEYFGTATTAAVTVTFPKADVYELDLSGTPHAAGQPGFAMDYEVRVTPGAQTAKPASTVGPQVLLIGLAVFVIFCMFAAYRIATGKRYTKNNK